MRTYLGLFPALVMLLISRWICSVVMEDIGWFIRDRNVLRWSRLYSASVEGDMTPLRDSIYFV